LCCAALLALGAVLLGLAASPPAAAQGAAAGLPPGNGGGPAPLGGIPVTWSLGLVLVLTLLNALFSMAETALVSVRRSRVEQLLEEGVRGAASVKRLVENPPRFIATIQVGITLLGFASAAAAATTLARPLTGPLALLGLSASAADTVAVILVTVSVALFTMILGEIAPKSLAVQAPDRWALRLAPFVGFCATLFAPLNWLVIRLSNVLVRPFGAKAQFESPVITEEELKQIIDAGEEAGELEQDEKEMIHNVFGLGETLVRSVMTPRIDMTAVSVESDLGAILKTIIASGHSRIPVYQGSVDNIVGIVHAKDLLPTFEAEEHDVELNQVMRAPYFVPETKRVSDLLAEFRRSNQQLAVVQDEYAGTEGIVTIEDLLEEIVGDIRDEYDVDEPEVQVISATESLVDGRMSIDDVNDRLGTDLPHEDYETIGGLVFGQLGKEPLPGDRVRLEGLEFLVEQTEGRRIRTLRVVKVDGLADAAAAATVPDTNGAAAAPARGPAAAPGEGDRRPSATDTE
jgi:CBS domain containing-hemolysin-like protein